MLTQTQKDALRWIDRFPVNKVRWMRKGKSAYGPSEKWDAIELSGPRGSILIPTGDWEAIQPLKVMHPDGPNAPKIWVLNEAGREALAA